MISKQLWGCGEENRQVFLYTLKNEFLEADITNFGATLVALRVPDEKGNRRDVLLGYDSLKGYREGNCYFGALVGRCANRIGQGKITISGKTYKLTQNEGTNHHHSADNCTAFATWQVLDEESNEKRLVLTCENKEKAGSFPGNVTIRLVYELLDHDLHIRAEGVSDQDTVMNLTSHGYFQLDGHDAGSVENQWLKIYAENYTPLREGTCLPTGQIRPVEGTPFDFKEYHRIGERIHATQELFDSEDCDQLRIGKGYDHNFILSEGVDEITGLRKAAEAYGPESRIHMTMYTDCPCLQLYTGNYISHQNGKEGVVYEERTGFCLEPQYTPNAMNMEGFEKPLVKAGETYHFETVYRFGLMPR